MPQWDQVRRDVMSAEERKKGNLEGIPDRQKTCSVKGYSVPRESQIIQSGSSMVLIERGRMKRVR